MVPLEKLRGAGVDIYVGELSFGPTPSDAIEKTEDIKSVVADPSQIPISDFDGATDKLKDNRRKALLNKLDAVIMDIETAIASTDPATQKRPPTKAHKPTQLPPRQDRRMLRKGKTRHSRIRLQPRLDHHMRVTSKNRPANKRPHNNAAKPTRPNPMKTDKNPPTPLFLSAC